MSNELKEWVLEFDRPHYHPKFTYETKEMADLRKDFKSRIAEAYDIPEEIPGFGWEEPHNPKVSLHIPEEEE